MNKDREKWALFWCTLLEKVIFGEVRPQDVNRYLKNLSKETIRFPDGKYKKPSLSSLKRKLRQYQEKRFEGLLRKGRNDRGKPRSFSREILDKAVELKKDQPKRSAYIINLFLKKYYDETVPHSTLYRYLRKHGATRLKLGVSKEKVRCRWSREHTNELWIGDFSDGPYVLDSGEVKETHLCLFIDCYSRYVIDGRYYLKESLAILLDSLLRAISIHGPPVGLYVDNAKVYHANALKAACFDLGIRKIHRTKRDPAPGGLVERLFGTNQGQFESEVRAGDILTFEKLNRGFSAWVACAYHEKKHFETGQSPRARYHQGLGEVRYVDMDKVRRYFMHRIPRTVNSTFSDVSLDCKCFKVDPKYRGDKVLVFYDPFTEMDEVLIYTLDEVFLTKAPRYEREKGAHEVEDPPEKHHKPKHNLVDLLIEEHEKQLRDQARGIDFQKMLSYKGWPFSQFIQKLSELLGKKGDISSFSPQELETLKKVHSMYPDLNHSILVKAFEQAAVKKINHVIYQLQLIFSKEK